MRPSLPDALPWAATHGTWPNDMVNDMAQSLCRASLRLELMAGPQTMTFTPPIIISPLPVLNDLLRGERLFRNREESRALVPSSLILQVLVTFALQNECIASFLHLRLD